MSDEVSEYSLFRAAQLMAENVGNYAGSDSDASAAYRRIVPELEQMKSGHPGIYIFLGEAYLKIGEYNLAVDCIKHALAHPEGTVFYREMGKEGMVYYFLGRAWAQLEQDEEATRHYDLALEKGVGDAFEPTVHRECGRAAFNKSREYYSGDGTWDNPVAIRNMEPWLREALFHLGIWLHHHPDDTEIQKLFGGVMWALSKCKPTGSDVSRSEQPVQSPQPTSKKRGWLGRLLGG